jgi:hypothetical protein
VETAHDPLTALSVTAEESRLLRTLVGARTWTALHQLAALLTDVGDDATAVLLAGGIGPRNLGAQIRLPPEALDSAGRALGPRQHARHRRGVPRRPYE